MENGDNGTAKKRRNLIIGIVISVIIIGAIVLIFNYSLTREEVPKYEDFQVTAGETWNNIIPFRYTTQSCQEWFISLNIGGEDKLDYCFIKDFEIRDDITPSTINCRCWLKGKYKVTGG